MGTTTTTTTTATTTTATTNTSTTMSTQSKSARHKTCEAFNNDGYFLFDMFPKSTQCCFCWEAKSDNEIAVVSIGAVKWIRRKPANDLTRSSSRHGMLREPKWTGFKFATIKCLSKNQVDGLLRAKSA